MTPLTQSNPKRLEATRKRSEALKALEYNGWPTYEAWNVWLWMSNDEQAYHLYRDAVRSHKGYFGGREAEEVCRSAFGVQTPDGVYFGDRRIHWGRIAAAMRER